MSDLSGDDHDDQDYGGDDGVDGIASTRKRRASSGVAPDGEKKPRVARPKKKGGRRRKKKDSDDDEEDEIEESEPELYDEDDFVTYDTEPAVPKDTTLYCSCRQTYNPRRPMVGCDSCNEWYHLNCVGLKKADAEAMPTYECPACKEKIAAGIPIERKADAPSDGGDVQQGGDAGVQQHDPNSQEAVDQHNAALLAAQQQQAALAQYQYQNMQQAGAGVRPMGVYPGMTPQYGMVQQQPQVVQPVAPVTGAPPPRPVTFGDLSEADKEKYRRQLAIRNQQLQQHAQQQALLQQQQMAMRAQQAAVAGNGLTMGGVPQQMVGVPQQLAVPQQQVTSAPPAAEQSAPPAAAPEQVAVAPVQ